MPIHVVFEIIDQLSSYCMWQRSQAFVCVQLLRAIPMLISWRIISIVPRSSSRPLHYQTPFLNPMRATVHEDWGYITNWRVYIVGMGFVWNIPRIKSSPGFVIAVCGYVDKNIVCLIGPLAGPELFWKLTQVTLRGVGEFQERLPVAARARY